MTFWVFCCCCLVRDNWVKKENITVRNKSRENCFYVKDKVYSLYTTETGIDEFLERMVFVTKYIWSIVLDWRLIFAKGYMAILLNVPIKMHQRRNVMSLKTSSLTSKRINEQKQHVSPYIIKSINND